MSAAFALPDDAVPSRRTASATRVTLAPPIWRFLFRVSGHLPLWRCLWAGWPLTQKNRSTRAAEKARPWPAALRPARATPRSPATEEGARGHRRERTVSRRVRADRTAFVRPESEHGGSDNSSQEGGRRACVCRAAQSGAATQCALTEENEEKGAGQE